MSDKVHWWHVHRWTKWGEPPPAYRSVPELPAADVPRLWANPGTAGDVVVSGRRKRYIWYSDDPLTGVLALLVAIGLLVLIVVIVVTDGGTR